MFHRLPDIVKEVLPGRLEWSENAAPPGVPGGLGEVLDGPGGGEGHHHGVHSVMAVVVSLLDRPATEDGVQAEAVSQVGRYMPAPYGLHAALPLGVYSVVVEVAVKKAQVLLGEARGVAGVVQLAAREAIQKLLHFLTRHLEAPQLLLAAIPCEGSHTLENFLPSLWV